MTERTLRDLTIEEFQSLVTHPSPDGENVQEDRLDNRDADNLATNENWGVYCNCLTIDPGTGGFVRYQRGPKGTLNYGCGSERWKAAKTLAKHIKKVGTCPSTQCGNRTEYLVSNYQA